MRGNSIGRKLGFPTANIPVAAEMPVQDGVYAAEVRVGGALYRAMVNIGTRPTVGDGAGRFAEANLFGFDGYRFIGWVCFGVYCIIKTLLCVYFIRW